MISGLGSREQSDAHNISVSCGKGYDRSMCNVFAGGILVREGLGGFAGEWQFDLALL